MELSLIGPVIFFTVKGIISLTGIVWTGRKVKKYIRGGNEK